MANKNLQSEAIAEPRPPATICNTLTVTYLVTVSAALATFFSNLRFGADVFGAGFEDDFYYYAQTARNLALHGRSTFDGIHLTNGYHPLWMLVLTLVTKIWAVGGLLHSSTALPLAFALECVQCALVVLATHFVIKTCRIFCSDTVSCCVALLTASVLLILARTGMEAGLVLVAAFGLAWFRLRPAFSWSYNSSFQYGFLCACMVLSRLDAILLVGTISLLDLPFNRAAKNGQRILNALAFAAGLTPIAVYFAINLWIFKAALPVSGTAKQLRSHMIPSLRAMESFAHEMFAPRAPVYPLFAAAIVIAIVFLVTGRRSLPSDRRSFFWAVLAFPILHFMTIVVRSDWVIWQWYLYAWPIAGVIAAIVLLQRTGSRKVGQSQVPRLAHIGCVSFLCLYTVAVVRTTSPKHDLTYQAALQIHEFARTHNGVYAMGDRSGAVGFLLDHPVIQLEGLMMDSPYLANIRAQKDLQTVLKTYGVRYYIATRAVRTAEGCYIVKEPFQAGPDSPAMRSRICRTPVAMIQHKNYDNEIFDMQ